MPQLTYDRAARPGRPRRHEIPGPPRDEARQALGAAAEPVAALRSSGRTERIAAERSATEAMRGAR